MGNEIIKVQSVGRGYLLNYDIQRATKKAHGPEIFEDRNEMIDRLGDLLDLAETTETRATPPPDNE